jgi:hypothetical protein
MKWGTGVHPKMYELAEALGILPAQAVGHLTLLLEWAPRFALSGYFGRHSPAAIARAAGWVEDPERFVTALIQTRWLDVVPASAIARTARYGPGDDRFFDEDHPGENPPDIGHKSDGYSTETRQPSTRRHLVIHDITDHAEETWRARLARAGYTWWNGAPARREKRGRPSPKAERRHGDGNSAKSRPSPKPEARSQEPGACSQDSEEGHGRTPRAERAAQSPPAGENPPAEDPDPDPDPGPAPPVSPLTAVASPYELMRAWNEFAPHLVPCHDMTPTRLKLARTRLAERPALAEWVRIFRAMDSSPFLRGANQGRWRPNLDWALKPETGLRVLEGQYDVAPDPQAAVKEQIEALRRRAAAAREPS